MMHMNVYYSYLRKYTPMLMMNVFLKLINLNLQFVMIVITLQIMMGYALTGLYILITQVQ